jgi:hypothetical protein
MNSPLSFYIKMALFSIVILIHNFSSAQSYLGVTQSQVNLRLAPNKEATIIKSLTANSQIFVISPTEENGYVQVIDIKSNTEGYVYKSYINFVKQLKANEEGIFTATGKTDSYGSELTVKNDTELTLTLKFNETTYSFRPNETKIIHVSAGNYNYRASAPGVLPDFGNENLQSGTSYSWTFYIVTSYK